ncbi:cellulose synthase-like protein H1 [Prunus yedoensis var. nudiflora]|uniref:Cellulose synthase-like protein H1 n=1 Tax=Prunus yedoensis var. nudiflora TaxID=2094558 RepID=A0A314UTW4_PRUYE|nr:cellulose synthase-like protein H1 [Prunus yedoensis var. nudiflora]
MANPNSLPLHERFEHKNTLHKVMEFIILFLLLSLLVYRLLSFNNNGFTWLIAFLCELSFTFNWIITINNKWNIVEHKTYPDRLLQRYFSNNNTMFSGDKSNEFKREWKTLKDEYEQLSRKVEDAVRKSIPFDLSGDFAVFSDIEGNNHPTIIKVVWENKVGASNGLPHLVYISREKRPKHPHHSKAGAMNVLTRVSGLMTNAPFMLNVDCDMLVNNPNMMFHAMCMLLGSKNETENAFVQFPQIFYDGLKDDPFGNQMIVLWKVHAN